MEVTTLIPSTLLPSAVPVEDRLLQLQSLKEFVKIQTLDSILAWMTAIGTGVARTCVASVTMTTSQQLSTAVPVEVAKLPLGSTNQLP